MGWFANLFGKKGPRKPPAWARDAFGDDGARFDAFVEVVLEVLATAGHAASEMDVRTGSVLLGDREWVFEGAARTCANAVPAAWPQIVQDSLDRLGGSVEDDEEPSEVPDAPRRGSGGKAWIIGAAPWGVVFECGEKSMVLLLLPSIEPVVAPVLPPGLVKRVIVCNAGSEGFLAATATARAAGLAHVFAIDPALPIDRGGVPVTKKPIEVRPLETLKEGPLTVERAGTAVRGTWHDGVRFLAGDAIPMSLLASTGPDYVIGKLVTDEYDAAKLVDAMLKLKRALIVANTPGPDAHQLATVFSTLGVTAEILNGDPGEAPPRKQFSRLDDVLAAMVVGDLDRADALAVDAIAAGDRVDEIRHQRAMIALMRGDEVAADAELAKIDTPQALSSRAIIAAKRGDAAALDLAKRAVAQLPGDEIAIRGAVSVHAIAGDRAGARALLVAHGHHLDAWLRDALDAAIDDPALLASSIAHRFPEHAKMALAAVAPIVTAGNYIAAEAMLRRAHGWDPDNVGVIAELGFALSGQKKDDEAIALYDAAIERGGEHDLLRFNRANCLLRRKSFTQAIADYRVCLELKPDWHDVRVNLTSALFASGDKSAAKAEVSQLEKLGGPAQHVAALREMLAGTL